MRRLQGFDTVLRRVSGVVSERMIRMEFLGSAVRVSEQQFPRIHWLHADVAATLDVDALPELYVASDPRINAVCIGMDKPIIVLTSGLVEALDDTELAFVIGHELGHMLTGHAVYRTLLQVLVGLSGAIGALPLGAVSVRVIQAALMEWQRKSELSADRAGLLATQDPAAALRTHMKLASGGTAEGLDSAAFLAQAKEYRETDSLRDSILKLMLLEGASHPYAVVRAAELHTWSTGGSYQAILRGNYPKKVDDSSARMSDEAKAAADSYAEAFAESNDALSQLLRDVGSRVGQVKDWMFGAKGDS